MGTQDPSAVKLQEYIKLLEKLMRLSDQLDPTEARVEATVKKYLQTHVLTKLNELFEKDMPELELEDFQKIMLGLSISATLKNTSTLKNTLCNFETFVNSSSLSSQEKATLVTLPQYIKQEMLLAQIRGVLRRDSCTVSTGFDENFIKMFKTLSVEGRKEIFKAMNEKIYLFQASFVKDIMDAFEEKEDKEWLMKQMNDAIPLLIKENENNKQRLQSIFNFLEGFSSLIKNKKETEDFLKSGIIFDYQEMSDQKKLSQMFSIKDENNKMFSAFGVQHKREGEIYAKMFNILKKDLSGYVNSNGSDNAQKALYKEVCDIFQDHNASPSLGYEVIPFVVNGNHGAGMLVYKATRPQKDLICIINRGDRQEGEKPGIVVYEGYYEKISDSDRLVALKKSFESSGSSQAGVNLGAFLGGNGFQAIDYLPMKNQTFGNCSWASSKGFVYAAFYVAIRNQLLNQEPTLVPKALNAKAMEAAREHYKKFTKFSRLKHALAYLEKHERTQFQKADKVLVREMYERIKRYSPQEVNASDLQKFRSLAEKALGLSATVAFSVQSAPKFTGVRVPTPRSTESKDPSGAGEFRAPRPPLKATSAVQHKRAGENYAKMFNILKQDLSGYVSSNVSNNTQKALYEEVGNIFQDKTSDPRLSHEAIPFFVNADHPAGMLVYKATRPKKDLICIINRGESGDQAPPGIVVYEGNYENISNLQNLNKLKESFKSKDPSEAGVNLGGFLQANGFQAIDDLPMKSQTIRNGSWASSKGFVYAAFYVAIRNQLLNQEPELDVQALNRKAMESARKHYREFKKFSRLKHALAYLEKHEGTQFQKTDKIVLEKMYRRITKDSKRGVDSENLKRFRDLAKKALEHSATVASPVQSSNSVAKEKQQTTNSGALAQTPGNQQSLLYLRSGPPPVSPFASRKPRVSTPPAPLTPRTVSASRAGSVSKPPSAPVSTAFMRARSVKPAVSAPASRTLASPKKHPKTG